MHKTVYYRRGWCESQTKNNRTKHDSGLHVEAVLIWGKIKQQLCYVNKTHLQIDCVFTMRWDKDKTI